MGRTKVAVLLLGVAVLSATAPVQADDDETIQPGDAVGGCTLSFVFDSTTNDSVYMTTAAHCVDEGESVTTPGFGTLGEVVVDGRDQGDLDYALIDVDPALEGEVSPAVNGHPSTPTGFTTADGVTAGDPIWLSGHGVPFGLAEPTRENRAGVLVEHDDRRYRSQSMVSFGDSGGPLVHVLSGEAVGIVSRVGSDPPPANLIGPTVEGVIEDLDARGWSVSLRTV